MGAEYQFIGIAGKDICLICGANVAEIKEFNLRHSKGKNQDKLKNIMQSRNYRK